MPPVGLGASIGLGGDDAISMSSSGVGWGVGDWTWICATWYGCLWGRGETSIRSCIGPGEEDGRGGVVTDSAKC